jgi:hypothetical protein
MVLVCSSSLSAKVLLPWSIWAMMQKFLIFFISGKDKRLQRSSKYDFGFDLGKNYPSAYHDANLSRQGAKAQLVIRIFNHAQEKT